MRNYFYLFICLFLAAVPITGYSQDLIPGMAQTFLPEQGSAFVLELEPDEDQTNMQNYYKALEYRLGIQLEYNAATDKDRAILGNFDIRIKGRLVRVKGSFSPRTVLDPYDGTMVQPIEFFNDQENTQDSRFDLHIYQNLDGTISQNFIDYKSRVYSKEILFKKDVDNTDLDPTNDWKTAVLIESITAEYPNSTTPIELDPTLFTLEARMDALPIYGKVGNEFSSSAILYGSPPRPFIYDVNDETLKWNDIENAHEYEVEWFFIDKYDPLYTIIKNVSGTMSINYEARRGVRIRTTDEYYVLRMGTELTYPEGLVYFRVRGVGKLLPEGESDVSKAVTVKGAWQSSPFFLRIHDENNDDNFTNSFKIDRLRHQPDKTWQYSTVYAEEGKYKKVMSYFDASLRSSQTLTNFTTDRTFGEGNGSVTLVEEQFYDYEGRQVIQTIPAPMRTASLAYKNGNSGVAGEGVNYFPNQKKSYDKDHTDATSDPLADESLTASYYSPSPLDLVNFGRINAVNPELKEFKHNAYIPISEGYAYTQVKYSQDGTGRVAAQSGIGKTFRMGGGKEVKYFYLTPTEYEIKRLFGNYVGDVSHYKKVLTVDPNGQKSVAYIDQAGQTIATGLVGESPESLRALNDNPTKEGNIGYTTVDLSKSNKRSQTLSRTEHTFFNPLPLTRYTVSYDMEGAITEFKNREGESYCKVCTYQVNIYLINKQGKKVFLSEDPNATSPIAVGMEEYVKVIEPNQDDNDLNNYDPAGEDRPDWCEEDDQDNNKPINRVKLHTIELFADLGDGEYTLIKELTLLNGEGEEFETFTDRELAKGDFEQRSLDEAREKAIENCTYCAEYMDEDGVQQSLGNGADCEEILQELQAATEELAAFECQSIWQSYVVDNPSLNLDSQNPIKGGGSSCYDACEDLEEARVYDFYFGNIERYDLAATGVYKDIIVDFTDPISLADPTKRDPFWEKWLAQPQQINAGTSIQDIQNEWMAYNIVFDGVPYPVHGSGGLLTNPLYYQNVTTLEEGSKIAWAIFSGGYQLFKRAKMKTYYENEGCSNTSDILPDQEEENNLLDPTNLVTIKEEGDKYLEAAGSIADCPEWATLKADALMFGADASQCGVDNEWDKWELPLSQPQSDLLADITTELQNYCAAGAYNLTNQTRELYYDPGCYYVKLDQFITYADGLYGQAGLSILNAEGVLQADVTSVDLVNWFNTFIDTYTEGADTREAFKAHFNRATPPQNPTGDVYFDYEEGEWLELAPSVVMSFIELSIRATTQDDCTSPVDNPEGTASNDALDAIKTSLSTNGYCLTPFYAALKPASCKKYEVNVLHIRDYDAPIQTINTKGLQFKSKIDENPLTNSPAQTFIDIPENTSYNELLFRYTTTIEASIRPSFPATVENGFEFSIIESNSTLTPPIQPGLPTGAYMSYKLSLKYLNGYYYLVFNSTNHDALNINNYRFMSSPILPEDINQCRNIAVSFKNLARDTNGNTYSRLTLFINGGSVGTDEGTDVMRGNYPFAGNMSIGKNNNSNFSSPITNNAASCIIKEIRIWNKYKTEFPYAGRELPVVLQEDPTLLGYWKLIDEPFEDGSLNNTEINDGIFNIKDYSLTQNHSVTDLSLGAYQYLPSIEEQTCVVSVPTKQVRIRTCTEYDPILSEFMVYKTMDDLVEDCINNLVDRAEEETQTIKTVQKDILTKRLEEKYKNDCFKSPFKEKLELKYKAAEHQYTLYYYDQAGNLYQTVPPEGVRPLTLSEVTAGNVNPSHKLQTTYHYNTLGQLVWQNTPDRGTSQMWVDYYGRVRLSQNKEQATLHLAAADAIREDTQFEYAYTKYDALGRPYEAGKIDINPTADNKDPLTDIESKVDINELIFDDNFPLIGEYRVLAPTDADSRAVETLTFELSERTKTYYDNTPISDALAGTAIVDPTQQHYLRNRVAAVAVYEEGEIIGAVTRYSYDIHGNVEQLWQQLPKIAISENTAEDILFPEKTVRYDYDLLSGKVNQVIFQEGLEDEFRHKYSYDGDNKLTQVHTSLDGIYWTLEAKYFYYAHGPLARVEIGEHNIQGVDYYYTLQGWIKGVNSPEGTFGKDGTEDNPTFNTDEFAYTLHYFEGDYTARGNSASPNNNIFGNAFNTDEDYSLFTGFFDQTEPSGSSANGFPLADSYDRKSLYNGNVAAMTTSIAHFGRREDGNGRATQSMNYRYDQLHRIAAASSKQWNLATGVWESQTLGKAYQTSYQYDRNGNIEKLHRKNQAGLVIDNLQYSYDPVKKNQLYRVTDQAANVDNANFSANGLNYGNHLYEYDEIGNLIKNGSDGIQSIIWNIQGKVEKVVRTNATITYRYDASGNRITKQVATTTTNHVNLYLRDASGNVMSIYEYDKTTTNTIQPTIQLKEIPIYGGSRLGQYRRSYTNQVADKKTALGQRVYEFSNHLQNVLVVLADFKVPIQVDTEVSFKAIVVSANDYYPFGMVMEGRKYRDPNYDYRYGFNGKEDDKDFGDKQLIQDYGFRLYNPALVRFLSVDPLAPSYPELTVYQFASNTPIWAIDLDGLEMTVSTMMNDIQIRMNQKGVLSDEYIRESQKAQGVVGLIGLGLVTGGLFWEAGLLAAPTLGTTSSISTGAGSGYLYSTGSQAAFKYFMINAGTNFTIQHSWNTFKAYNSLPSSMSVDTRLARSFGIAFRHDDWIDVGVSGFTGPFGRFNSLRGWLFSASNITGNGINALFDWSYEGGFSSAFGSFGGKPKNNTHIWTDFVISMATAGFLDNGGGIFRATGKYALNYGNDSYKNEGITLPYGSFLGNYYYKIQEGDTPSQVAERHGTSVGKMIEMNSVILQQDTSKQYAQPLEFKYNWYIQLPLLYKPKQ